MTSEDDVIAVDRPTPAAPRTGLRRAAATGYRWLLLAFLLLGVVQIFLAGLGVFNLDGEQLGTDSETALDPHRNLGFMLSPVALVIVVLAVLARPGARAVVLSVVLLLLVGVGQSPARRSR